MDKKKPLSYSGYQRYMVCPHQYKLHYVDKIRPVSTPFHLIFGGAVDKALNALLELHPASPIDHADLVLARLFTEDVEFSEKDYDYRLLDRGPVECIKAELKSLGWKGDNVDDLANALFNRRNGQELTDNQSNALKFLVFYSAREHVKLIIQSFIRHILPEIEKVVSVQREVKRGILDFEAIFHGVEGVVVVDNKTASRPYKKDAVEWSVQHASYGALTGAYVVFVKSDKGPDIVPQLILQKVPEHNVKMVEETYQQAEAAIDAGHFPRNLSACGKQFGRPCQYAGLCWENSMKGLVKKDETK